VFKIFQLIRCKVPEGPVLHMNNILDFRRMIDFLYHLLKREVPFRRITEVSNLTISSIVLYSGPHSLPTTPDKPPPTTHGDNPAMISEFQDLLNKAFFGSSRGPLGSTTPSRSIKYLFRCIRTVSNPFCGKTGNFKMFPF
jgi:hypothetical protein